MAEFSVNQLYSQSGVSGLTEDMLNIQPDFGREYIDFSQRDKTLQGLTEINEDIQAWEGKIEPRLEQLDQIFADYREYAEPWLTKAREGVLDETAPQLAGLYESQAGQEHEQARAALIEDAASRGKTLSRGALRELELRGAGARTSARQKGHLDRYNIERENKRVNAGFALEGIGLKAQELNVPSMALGFIGAGMQGASLRAGNVSQKAGLEHSGSLANAGIAQQEAASQRGLYAGLVDQGLANVETRRQENKEKGSIRSAWQPGHPLGENVNTHYDWKGVPTRSWRTG